MPVPVLVGLGERERVFSLECRAMRELALRHPAYTLARTPLGRLLIA
eukprot:COSAG02_NODE_65150_length_258_cov_1.754717_1_plen_46_part_10